MNHASSRQLRIVGYYQAPERVGDTALSPVGERVASKIKETFPTPMALVVSVFGTRNCLSVTCPIDQRIQA
jgi:Uncharacterised protein family (UPF0172)